MITIMGFGSGFLSIIFSLEGNFITASKMIILAMVFDAMDGAIARATKTESLFGQQLDSLADVVSFACAPAILLYLRFGLGDHPKFYIFPLFYATAGAMRLARYNAIDILASNPNRDFRGTPIPAPAGIIAAMVMAMESHGDLLSKRLVIAFVFTLSYLMVSSIRYPSLSVLRNPKRPRPFRFLVMAVLIIVLLFYRFAETVLILGALYYLSGPLMGIRSIRRTANSVVPGEPSREDDDA